VAIAWYVTGRHSNTVPLTTNWTSTLRRPQRPCITPVFTLSQATDHVNHGQISTGGPLAAPTRTLPTFSRRHYRPIITHQRAYADNMRYVCSYFTRPTTATSASPQGNVAGTTHQQAERATKPGKPGSAISPLITMIPTRSRTARLQRLRFRVSFQATHSLRRLLTRFASVTLTGLDR